MDITQILATSDSTSSEHRDGSQDEQLGDDERLDRAALTAVSDPVHSTLCFFFLVICYLENSVVLHVYAKRRNLLATEVYYIALAILDMFACATILPQFPLLQYYDDVLYEVFFSLLTFVLCTNVTFLAMMSLDRLKAVTRPLQYTKKPAFAIKATSLATLLQLVAGIAVNAMDRIYTFTTRLYVFVTLTAAFGTLIYSYSRIIYSLYARRAQATVSAVEMTGGRTIGRYMYLMILVSHKSVNQCFTLKSIHVGESNKVIFSHASFITTCMKYNYTSHVICFQNWKPDVSSNSFNHQRASRQKPGIGEEDHQHLHLPDPTILGVFLDFCCGSSRVYE